ncbi:speckle-type POZ protein B-like [Paramacrobiotus metropolitanus]|uniref:speckle-type POZ protein B-like n=1 Tax=Paramacrobiotus metropolitanus TaxID=2943436 RepID=UPI0024463032|nr:speckle-type POZ protein B-like [Paramacrobiotus metropolitanus]
MDVNLRNYSASPAFATFPTASRAGYGWRKAISYQQLLDELKDDSVTFTLDVVLYAKHNLALIPESIISKPFEADGKFLLNFTTRQSSLLMSEDQSHSTDFVLHSSDGQEFAVSCNFFAAQSPVFAAMFKHDCKEKKESRCDLVDVDGESLGILLDYVYGCKFSKINVDNAEKVLVMADKYEMLDLRSVCEQILAENIPLDKAAHYFVLAKQRGLDTLKNAVLDVLPGNMERVLHTEAFQEVMGSDAGLLPIIVEYASRMQE